MFLGGRSHHVGSWRWGGPCLRTSLLRRCAFVANFPRGTIQRPLLCARSWLERRLRPDPRTGRSCRANSERRRRGRWVLFGLEFASESFRRIHELNTIENFCGLQGFMWVISRAFGCSTKGRSGAPGFARARGRFRVGLRLSAWFSIMSRSWLRCRAAAANSCPNKTQLPLLRLVWLELRLRHDPRTRRSRSSSHDRAHGGRGIVHRGEIAAEVSQRSRLRSRTRGPAETHVVAARSH